MIRLPQDYEKTLKEAQPTTVITKIINKNGKEELHTIVIPPMSTDIRFKNVIKK